ncbi:MAG: hypothetical protein RLZZ242_823 [Bacteroidota bacterium]|jgi:glycerol-3-phosphate dehydrogenase (NAD(P)+)
MPKKPIFGVIGGGSFGTALAKILNDNGYHLQWYVHEQAAAEAINRFGKNPDYLKEVQFNTALIKASSSLKDTLLGVDIVLLVVPSAYVHRLFKDRPLLLKDRVVFSAIKGIVPETGQVIQDYLLSHCQVLPETFGVIAGPAHAEEIALERMSYLTVASSGAPWALILKQALSNHYVRVNLSNDTVGTEYAAVLKNVYAIAAGIADGLDFGDNFQSVLISNAIREMKRFITRKQKLKRNINQSAYLGDLLVTAYSRHSRNRQFGLYLAQQMSENQIKSSMAMVAEGAYAVRPLLAMARAEKKPLKTPILDAVYAVLAEQKDARTVFETLKLQLT